MHDLGLKTSIQTFDVFVRCTLMGNQPWPQFQNGIWERSCTFSISFQDFKKIILHTHLDITVRCLQSEHVLVLTCICPELSVYALV